MAHQFVREPLRAEEADRLANACRSPEEKLIVWTLLDTGLRVSELCSLTLDNVQWQQRSLRVTGKAGPHGSRRKFRLLSRVATMSTQTILPALLSVHVTGVSSTGGGNRNHTGTPAQRILGPSISVALR